MDFRTLFMLGGLAIGPACTDDDPGPPGFPRETIADEIGNIVCGAFETCTCTSDALPSIDECKTALEPSLERVIVEGEQLDLTYHRECVPRVRTLVETFGCATEPPEDDDALVQAEFDAASCKLLAGTGLLGDPCVSVPALPLVVVGDTCTHALVCGGGVCRERPQAEGDLCDDVCPPGLACLDHEADGVLTCVPRASLAASCNPHESNGCEADLYCRVSTAKCEALPIAGSACLDGLCAEGSTCVDDVCTQLPGGGLPCLGGLCDSNLYCDPATVTCLALPREGEACLEGTVCRSGSVCDPTTILCMAASPLVCELPNAVGVCLYAADGICDEPELGTGFCLSGTDPVDCICATRGDRICDEPEGTSRCTENTDPEDCAKFCETQLDGLCDTPDGNGSGECAPGTDEYDCLGPFCPTANDGVCDEPEGRGTCEDGTDPEDCPPEPCAFVDDGQCDEPEGTGLCEEGTDPNDCAATPPCPYANDGECDEPEGTGLCPEGTDPNDCSLPPTCPYTNNGQCDEPEGTGLCPQGTDIDDCSLNPECKFVNDGECDEPEGTGFCPEGTDVIDCQLPSCATTNNGRCDEPEGTGLCPEGTDVVDCQAPTCAFTNDNACDEPEGTGVCPEGTDVDDCFCPTPDNGLCDEPGGGGTDLCPYLSDPEC